jgi:hypothetical protein
MCAWVGNQRSHGVVTARVRTDVVRSLRHQRRDLQQSTYSVPLGRSGLILLSTSLQIYKNFGGQKVFALRIQRELSNSVPDLEKLSSSFCLTINPM